MYFFGAMFILLVLTPLLVSFVEWFESSQPVSLEKLFSPRRVHFGLLSQPLSERTAAPTATGTGL
jgi:hypothetical protein